MSSRLALSARFVAFTSTLLFASIALADTSTTNVTGIPAAEAQHRYSKLPHPVSVTAPTEVPARYEGMTVNIAVRIDEQGNPTEVRCATRVPADLKDRILPVVAQWKFAPAEDLNGRTVPIRVVYPLHLVAATKRPSPTT